MSQSLTVISEPAVATNRPSAETVTQKASSVKFLAQVLDVHGVGVAQVPEGQALLLPHRDHAGLVPAEGHPVDPAHALRVAGHALLGAQVPAEQVPVARAAQQVRVVRVERQPGHARAVLLQVRDQLARPQLPHAHRPVAPARHQEPLVVAEQQGGDPLAVRVLHEPQRAARVRVVRAHAAVVPPGQDQVFT
eukprot:CAMPEP_0194689310 /NCGR_PEP_ID=MMETSP0295-20121207/17518_1 /TAXON_ID=39354 /ORGANISM="Heterosigma akashiwo, Strain CCMP2393" /LENGTH=191 /DNA_ID=CAMNT_0039578293 /DNA_START=292 /DNA_END=866 /DNA_ORIENTATION=+